VTKCIVSLPFASLKWNLMVGNLEIEKASKSLKHIGNKLVAY
jgi:hypothetical protein